MKLGVVPDNLIERLALLSGILPPGIFESWFGIMLARTIMVATKLEIIEMPADRIAKHLSLPRTARQMLDIGGSHGYFSVAICRRNRQLRSTILDLPEAIKHAAPLLAKEGLGDRIVHRTGNALTDDLGKGVYDLVFLASVIHHFDEATNRNLMRRIAQALRPGGHMANWEPLRQDRAGKIRQIGGLLDLFFGFFSEAGIRSTADVAGWYREAGLLAQKSWSPRMMPDLALHVGRKPG